jgi:hypothetical protein
VRTSYVWNIELFDQRHDNRALSDALCILRGIRIDAGVFRADVTRTITNEDDPHISAHGVYQLRKTTTNSGLVMRSIMGNQ